MEKARYHRAMSEKLKTSGERNGMYTWQSYAMKARKWEATAARLMREDMQRAAALKGTKGSSSVKHGMGRGRNADGSKMSHGFQKGNPGGAGYRKLKAERRAREKAEREAAGRCDDSPTKP